MAAKKKAAAKAPAKAKESTGRGRFGTDVIITSMPDENWRREGSGNHDRVKSLMGYWRKHKNATVRELLDKTDYRLQDYHWDMEKDVFKTKKVKPATKPAGKARASSSDAPEAEEASSIH